MTGNLKSTGPRPEDFSQILLNGKKPIEDGWQRYCVEKRRLSREQVNGHNVGNTCGPASDCIVLDIDHLKVFKAACKQNGWTVPETYTVQTGSGTPHCYFKYPQDGEKYGNKSFPKQGFDIRGIGGQVVAPGSIHPDTGMPYRVVKDIPMAPAPNWLLDIYKKDTQASKGKLIGAPNKYGATALANELTILSCTPKGGRNEQLNRSAHALGQLVAGGELEQFQVERALTAAAVGVGLSPSEVKATITSGLSSGMASPRRAPEMAQANTSDIRLPSNKQNLAKKPVVTLVPASQIKPEAVSWIWVGYIAQGKVHIIAGPPGHGKTTLLLGLLAILTIGGRWPDGTRAEACNVAIWSGEDDPADTLVPRLLACGADLNLIHIVSGVTEDGEKRSFDPSTDISFLRECIQEKGIKMLVIDPIVSAVGGDSHKNAETRRALQPIVDLAADLDCAVYGVTHFTKGTVGRDPVERVTGSLAFGALTRVVTVAMKLPDDGNHPAGARLFARAKSNIGPDGGGFYYFLEVGDVPGHEGLFNTRVLWGDALNGTAKELIAKAEMPGDDQSVVTDATDWLRDVLADGPKAAGDIQKEGKKAGFSKSSLWRAKDRLGVKSIKVGFAKGWGWKLPEEFTEDPIHLGVNSSDPKNMQATDSDQEFTKNPSHEFFGISGGGMNSSQSVNSSPKFNEEFMGLNSSEEPTDGKGLGGVKSPKNSTPKVLGSSEPAVTFELNDRRTENDLWEVEI